MPVFFVARSLNFKPSVLYARGDVAIHSLKQEDSGSVISVIRYADSFPGVNCSDAPKIIIFFSLSTLFLEWKRHQTLNYSLGIRSARVHPEKKRNGR